MRLSTLTIAIFIPIIFILNDLSAQNIYPDCWDGCMYLMLKPESQEINSTKKDVALKDFPLLNKIKDDYGIFAVEKINHFSPDKNMRRIFRVMFTKSEKIDILINQLLKNPDVKYAEKAPIIESLSVNDADYLASADYRWHLDVINAEAAWEVPRQINTVKIAVVDKAMDMDHPDLVAQWDTLYDICDDDYDTNPPSTVEDDHPSWSHGTHTSGLAGASTNNGVGIASVGYDVRLMGIKITNNEQKIVGGVTAPSGSMISAYEGVTWAADNGADIISMSWGSKRHSVIKQEIMNYAALTKKCLLVAGAGNSGKYEKYYPAALDNVIAVAGTDGDDKLSAAGMPPLFVSSGSNYGEWIDVCAPGFGMTGSNDNTKVYSTSFNDSYMMIGGTSMATPIVASLAALVKSINPDLSSEAIENIIKSTCVDIADLQISSDRENGVGAGRIDAAAAANAAYESIEQIIPSFSADMISIIEGESVNFTNQSSGNDIVSVKWTFPGAITEESTDENPQNVIYSTTGSYDVTLQVITSTDTLSLTKEDYIYVRTYLSNWQQQSSGFPTSHRAIKNIVPIDENIAWAHAFDAAHGGILNEFTRTQNGGDSWEPGVVSGTEIPSYLRISNIYPINYDKAFVCMHTTQADPVAPYGGIYVTEDGGITWTQQQNTIFGSEDSYPVFIHFFDENTGLCVGNPVDDEYEIYTTTDAGATWTQVPEADIPSAQAAEDAIPAMYDAYEDNVWFSTSKGRVYRSNDKGLTWSVSSTGLSMIEKITFADENTGIVQHIARNMLDTYVVTFENKITTDGGQSWSSFTPGDGIRKDHIDFVPGNPNMLFTVGTDGEEFETSGSAYSTDLGETWTNIDEGVYYSCVKMLNDSVGYAGGLNSSVTYGGIFKWIPEPEEEPSPTNIEITDNNLYSIYPNPASEYFNIEINNIENEVIIELFDLTGKQIINKTLTGKGTFSETFNLSNYPAGVYLLKLTIDNQILNEKIILR